MADITNMAVPGFDANGAADNTDLFQTIFNGMVVAAYNRETAMDGWTYSKSVKGRKAETFQLIGTADCDYHLTAGSEIEEQTIEHGQRLVGIDRPLLAAVSIDDWDELVSSIELQSRYAAQLGRTLAITSDEHKMIQAVRAARGTLKDGSAVPTVTGVSSAGSVIAANDIADTTKSWYARAEALAYALIDGEQAMADKDLPIGEAKIAFMSNADYFMMHKAATEGNAPWFNRDFAADNKFGNFASLRIGNTTLKACNHFVGGRTLDGGTTGKYLYYDGDFSDTRILQISKDAVATLNVMGMQIETGRDLRRQCDTIVARKAEGHETFKPECANEITATVA